MNFLPAYRPSRPPLILFAAAIAVITGLVLIINQPGVAHATTAEATVASHGGTQPTIVLVHGAWADGGSWAPVAERLQRLGYTVDIPPNTLRGVPQDSAYLKDFRTTITADSPAPSPP